MYQNSTVLDLVLNNQPYKTEAMVERQNALNQLHTTNAIKQQEALLELRYTVRTHRWTLFRVVYGCPG